MTGVQRGGNFKCQICASPYFGSLFEKGQIVGRYCKGWPTGYDRSYHPCKGKYEERYTNEPTSAGPLSAPRDPGVAS